MQNNEFKISPIGTIAAMWGIFGFLLLIGSAIYRLGIMSVDAFQMHLTTMQWLLLTANIFFMAYSEGYKGFQKHYAPRFAARALYLAKNGSTLERCLAPLFCMNFFNAPHKRLLVSYALLLMIILFIILFERIPQPWRGILDTGVVVGLIWGLASTGWYCFKAFSDSEFSIDPELRSLKN